MDIKHKQVWLRVKLFGSVEPTLIHGTSILNAMMQLSHHLAKAPNRYGPCSIDLDFSPLSQHDTEQEASLKSIVAGLDFSQIEEESPEESAKWERSPLNPESDSYDPIFVSYMTCNVTSVRDTKTPEDLKLLRNHVESKYTGTEWWDGSHKW